MKEDNLKEDESVKFLEELSDEVAKKMWGHAVLKQISLESMKKDFFKLVEDKIFWDHAMKVMDKR